MDVDSVCEATETGCSKRRNPFPFSASTFLRILKNNLKLHPFKYVVLPYLEHFKTKLYQAEETPEGCAQAHGASPGYVWLSGD